MTPDVTVIIAAYNAMPYVTRSVTSVLEQSFAPERIEVIAVDDGSTDGTGAELDRLAATASNMIVVHQENSGTPAAPRNLALDRATGRYVFFHDADDYLGTEALERMVTAADANGTDVVLGRMVGVGGRPAPRSMFTSTQPRTGVFSSRVYWTLGPQKLFRREMIERLGLRFQTRFPQGSDMPFVATAYLAASGITILADYDYVYLAWRDDARNITLTRTGLAERMAIASTMFDLVDELVGPGDDRDHLMQRHFAVEVVDTVMPPLVAETDAGRQAEAAAVLGTWVDRWYTPGVEHRMRPLYRVYLRLIAERRLEDLGSLLRWVSEGGVPEPVTEGERVYLAYPGFRDVAAPLPDGLFDATERLRVTHALAGVDLDGAQLAVRADARFTFAGDVSAGDLPADAELILRSRDSDVEYGISLEDSAGPGELLAAVDLSSAAAGEPLARGLWDACVRLRAGSIVREARLGRERTAGFPGLPHPGYLTVGGGLLITPYLTDAHGNLTFDVGGVKHDTPQALVIDRVAWSRSGGAVLAVSGRWAVSGVSADAVRFVLTSADGSVHAVRTPARTSVGLSFKTDLDLMTAAAGRPLPDGTWTLTVRIEAPGVRQGIGTPAPEEAQAVVRRGLRRISASLRSAEDGSIVVTVGRGR